MKGRPGKAIIPYVALSTLLLLTALLSINLFRYTNELKKEFSREKAALTSTNLKLKMENETLANSIQTKDDEIIMLNTKSERIEIEKEALKKEAESLKESLRIRNSLSAGKLIEEALAKEENETVKTILKDAQTKIEMVRSGKSVNLEPITVTAAGTASAGAADLSGPGIGKIISIDRKCNLIAIDIGERDGVRKGEMYAILRDKSEIASAEVISTRYRLAAAVIGNIKQGYTIKDIKEGDGVAPKKD